MSFVGTRPEAVKYVEKYKPEYMATLLLPAGITKIKGNILNITSSSAVRPGISPYIISKWGERSLTLAVLEKGKVGEVYNLGGHNEKANIEIVKIILEKLGKPESLITYVADRHGHDQRYAIDPAIGKII